MNVHDLTTYVVQKPGIQVPSTGPTEADIKTEQNLPELNGLAMNYANQNKWFAYLPLESILGKKYNGLELHVTQFSIPQMEMMSTDVHWKSYTKTIPLKVMNPASKELTIGYIVDENWYNYKALYLWMSSVTGNINEVVTNETISPIVPENYIPLRIYLLNSYKQKVIQFCYSNCWIKVFNEIQLDQNTANEVQASFTVCYDQFTIEAV